MYVRACVRACVCVCVCVLRWPRKQRGDDGIFECGSGSGQSCGWMENSASQAAGLLLGLAGAVLVRALGGMSGRPVSGLASRVGTGYVGYFSTMRECCSRVLPRWWVELGKGGS